MVTCNSSKDLSAEDSPGINTIYKGCKPGCQARPPSPRCPAAIQSRHPSSCSPAQLDGTPTMPNFSSQSLRISGAIKHTAGERVPRPVSSPPVLQTVGQSKAMQHTASVGTKLSARKYTEVDPMTASLRFSNMKSF